MKRIIIFFIICFISNPVFAICSCKCGCSNQAENTCISHYLPVDEMKFCRSFADQVKKERAAVSNALGLTEEQAKCRLELIRQNSAVLEEKYHALYEQNYKLQVLKAENATGQAIKAQEKTINCIKKEIKTVVNNENKEFKKILDKEQKAKLRMIQKLERKTVKDCSKLKDYYKSNPKMRPFALQNNQDCDCVKRVEE